MREHITQRMRVGEISILMACMVGTRPVTRAVALAIKGVFCRPFHSLYCVCYVILPRNA